MTGKTRNQRSKLPYTYMIAVEDRLSKFLQRMAENKAEDNQ